MRALPLLAILVLGGAPAAAQTSLTIYNDGRVLVRRPIPLELPRGVSQQKVPVGAVDPASVFPLDPDVTLLGTRYDAAVDEASVLRRALGRRIGFVNGKDTITAEVAGLDPERYRLPDGSISFRRPGIPLYPAELVSLDPTLTLTLRSAAPRHELRLGYFVPGGGWQASYQVILGPAGSARILGSAVVNGGPLRMDGVELQLLAGQVNVAPQPGYPARAEGALMAKAAIGVEAASEEKVGEFHLYSVPGTVSLQPGVVTTVALFEPATAPVTKAYEVQGQLPYWGGLPQSGDEAEIPVTVTYTVARARKTDFGDRPLPGGTARLFQPDSAGRLQLIGETAIGHTAAGQDLRLPAGTAFDLTAKRVQTNYVTRRDTVPGGGWRTVATADYRVTLANAGTEPVVIDVLEQRAGEWSVISSSVKPEKLSSTRTRFRVPVAAGGQATLTYRVRVVW